MTWHYRASSESPEYVAKAIDIEQKMRQDESGCINLTMGSLTEPPNALTSDYDVDIGDMPEVDDPPAIIGGEIQSASDASKNNR